MSDEVNVDAMTDDEFNAYLAGLTAAQATTAQENQAGLQRAFDEADAKDAERAADKAAARDLETQAVTILAKATAESDVSYQHTMALLRNYGSADVDGKVDDDATADAQAGDIGDDGTQEHDADVPEQASRPFEHAVVGYRRSA